MQRHTVINMLCVLPLCHRPVHVGFLWSETMTRTCSLTDISWGSTRCGHDVIVHHLGQAEVTDHDLGVFILAVVQDVFWLHQDTLQKD